MARGFLDVHGPTLSMKAMLISSIEELFNVALRCALMLWHALPLHLLKPKRAVFG